MKALLLAACWCLLLPTLALAHVGSPNVFFEGRAGSHPVRVVVRPPAALPGVAQVDVRIEGEGVSNVAVQATPWEASESNAAAPIAATPVAGEAGLFHAALWLFGNGSYRVRVSVDSSRGGGVVSVPLNSAATQRPAMPPALGSVLAGLGGLLGFGAVWLAGAAARDCLLIPGAAPTPRDHRRGRIASIVAMLLLTTAIGAGAIRWRVMDRDFREHTLDQPQPVHAVVENAGPLRLLRLTPALDKPSTTWNALAADHGKLMHLFLVREPDLTAFAHLHPVRRDGHTFENVLPPIPAGTYQLYAEITRENGASQTLVTQLAVPAPSGPALPPMADWKMVNELWCQSPGAPVRDAGQPFALDADDAWHLAPAPAASPATQTQVASLADGSSMVFHNAAGLVENREVSLRFGVVTAEGRRAALQPYMGMLGHAVVRRANGSVFTHLHPGGTASMAATEMLAARERPPNEPRGAIITSHEVTFPYAFPRPGAYRLWVQVRLEGRVQTAVFDMQVAPAF